jgi:hypothetical protein
LNPSYNVFYSQHFSKVYKSQAMNYRESHVSWGEFLYCIKYCVKLTLMFCLQNHLHWVFLLENSLFKCCVCSSFEFCGISFSQPTTLSSAVSGSCSMCHTTWEMGMLSRGKKIRKAKPSLRKPQLHLVNCNSEQKQLVLLVNKFLF